jgi:SMC interacting uncharacterized protein involved in chromosome segregation
MKYWSEGIIQRSLVTLVFPKHESFNQIFFALYVRLDHDFTAEEKRKDPFIKILRESAAFTPFQAVAIDEHTNTF